MFLDGHPVGERMEFIFIRTEVKEGQFRVNLAAILRDGLPSNRRKIRIVVNEINRLGDAGVIQLHYAFLNSDLISADLNSVTRVTQMGASNATDRLVPATGRAVRAIVSYDDYIENT